MELRLLTVEQVILIHDRIIAANELQGLAGGKSIDAVIGRVQNRVDYGLISDVYELAACYCACLAVGHAFNDANKRTAFSVMDMVLMSNGIVLDYPGTQAGERVIRLVLGEIDELDLARWLRTLSRRTPSSD